MVPKLSPCRPIQKYEEEEEEKRAPVLAMLVYVANITPFTLRLGTKRRVVKFTPRPFYPGDRAHRRLRQPLACKCPAACPVATVGSFPESQAAGVHLVSMSRMSGAIPPLLHMPAWRAHGQLRRCFKVRRGKKMGSEMGCTLQSTHWNVTCSSIRPTYCIQPNA